MKIRPFLLESIGFFAHRPMDSGVMICKSHSYKWTTLQSCRSVRWRVTTAMTRSIAERAVGIAFDRQDVRQKLPDRADDEPGKELKWLISDTVAMTRFPGSQDDRIRHGPCVEEWRLRELARGPRPARALYTSANGINHGNSNHAVSAIDGKSPVPDNIGSGGDVGPSRFEQCPGSVLELWCGADALYNVLRASAGLSDRRLWRDIKVLGSDMPQRRLSASPLVAGAGDVSPSITDSGSDIVAAPGASSIAITDGAPRIAAAGNRERASARQFIATGLSQLAGGEIESSIHHHTSRPTRASQYRESFL